MNDQIALSVTDAAAACGISRTKMYDLIKAGEIRPSKIGTRTVILRAQLVAMLERATA